MNTQLYIDVGVSHIRLRVLDTNGNELENDVIPSNRDLKELFKEHHIQERFGTTADAPIFIVGKLAALVKQALGNGYTFLDSAVQWLTAKDLQKSVAEKEGVSCPLAVMEISASGYSVVGIDENGELKDDLLAVNPRCGAGTGVNLDRVLQKLGLDRDDVDSILADYLGEAGRNKRLNMAVRADRCGVFGASATISDKNQGIPLEVALATTLKSEVLKVCRKLPEGFDRVLMLGRFFKWQFVRDCAEDYLKSVGVKYFDYDPENSAVLDSLYKFINQTGVSTLSQPDHSFLKESHPAEFPSFSSLLEKYSAPDDLRYCREFSEEIISVPNMEGIPVHIGLDVGSTMAKVVMADDNGRILFLDAYSNAGDTIATVKRVFSELVLKDINSLHVRSIGITGSARYQVQEALSRIYPDLSSRIEVLVENYAHAHGSIDRVREHLISLKEKGVKGLNEDFCVLVDIGGEDTKISTIALKEAELFNNAMNIKCSAGTGSLMDTLSALFGIPGAGAASKAAMEADKSFEINATCAVFLMENAQKLQAQGVPREEILASANWAIVENMARTLWSQVELPGNSIVLLHGQTMLSDPLPLAVTHRLQDYLGAPAYSLVPPYPGHRACIGLIRSMQQSVPAGCQVMKLSDFLDAHFEKSIIQCRGAACSDPEAVCNRTNLKCQGADGKQFSFTLGGCSAINELFAKAKEKSREKAPVKDSYKEIWDYIDSHNPKSDNPKRLVIPRSFVVSEWAYFLSQIFLALGIPVHVDNVQDHDLSDAQPFFDIDSCAPHMGAVGQFLRLAREPHGYILATQIEKLPTYGKSIGRTCTLNQGGVAVARGIAMTEVPDARIHLLNLDFENLESGVIADQLFQRIQPIFEFYNAKPDISELLQAVQKALNAHYKLREDVATMTAGFMEEAWKQGQRVALVVGREYLLNPGIYDSHVRRLLRDKDMLAIPSYVLDIELNEEFKHVYWRNPHAILTILDAVARKGLHKVVKQPRLAALFRRIEESDDLLPAVQISTFCCGPDSVTLPLAAELMKTRPFLLIQSDAVIKELAHLENRVNTYVRQLELGLHSKMKLGSEKPFEIGTLRTLENNHPLNTETDVICFPTLSDNRAVTNVLRGAGFTCIDNYYEKFDLERNVKLGRKVVGDSVCSPMAGVYADLIRAAEDFSRRKAENDPLVEGKTRLLFFDNAGTGPCRQGQYVEVHKLMFWREEHGFPQQSDLPEDGSDESCVSGNEAIMRFLVAREAEGYDIGLKEWTTLRIYQAVITLSVLQDIHYQASTVCRDKKEYEEFYADFLKMKEDVFKAFGDFHGPGAVGRFLTKLEGGLGIAKYFAYRLDGRDVVKPIKRFRKRWLDGKIDNGSLKPLNIHVTGEVYMRVAQGEEIFNTLLSILGFGRFKIDVAPLWAYFDYMIEESTDSLSGEIKLAEAEVSRGEGKPESFKLISENEGKIKNLSRLRWILRSLVAKPLYKAAGLHLPVSATDNLKAAERVLPTLRPVGELAPYVGEVILGLEHGADLFLNVAPTGCMVSAMGQVISPCLRHAVQDEKCGHVQPLFSADGEVNGELLSMSILKSLGPEKFLVKGSA